MKVKCPMLKPDDASTVEVLLHERVSWPGECLSIDFSPKLVMLIPVPQAARKRRDIYIYI